MPFITEEVHERLVCDVDPSAPDSVHLQPWPEADPSAVDRRPRRADGAGPPARRARPRRAGRLRRCGPASRSRAPWSPRPGWDALPDELRAHVADELNVVDGRRARPRRGDLVDVTRQGQLPVAGQAIRPRTPVVAAAIEAADAAALAAALRSGDAASPSRSTARPSRSAPTTSSSPRRPAAAGRSPAAGPETVALDLELTDELRAAGTVREIVRLVQDARKAQGLEVTDRIELWWEADGETAAALRAATDLLARRCSRSA